MTIFVRAYGKNVLPEIFQRQSAVKMLYLSKAEKKMFAL